MAFVSVLGMQALGLTRKDEQHLQPKSLVEHRQLYKKLVS
jgi:hypothetical protein